jgi:uncharacterized protein (TIGR00730 family)
MTRAITVYCSSSATVPEVYFQAAAELGCAIASQGWKLVYGGNNVGVMGALADATRKAGGKVIGITPQLLLDKGLGDPDCDELHVTQNIRQRKAMMEELGDAFVALPGGLGTLEEIFEIIVGRLLGYHSKPIILLNVAGYYDPLLSLIEHGIQQKFMKPRARELYRVCASVETALADLCAGLSAQPEP